MTDSAALASLREKAADVLRDVLDRMGVEAEVSAFDDGERIILDAHGAESGLVIGKKGATLDALQYLVNRIVFKQPGERPLVVVDAEGYRGRREDSLVDLAKRLAEKAQRSGKPVPVEPMSPHDRRIVHMALVDHPGVTTESEGEGPARRVVIFPKKRDESPRRVDARSRGPSRAGAVRAERVEARQRSVARARTPEPRRALAARASAAVGVASGGAGQGAGRTPVSAAMSSALRWRGTGAAGSDVDEDDAQDGDAAGGGARRRPGRCG